MCCCYSALDVIVDENLVEKSAELGKYFVEKLKKHKVRCNKRSQGQGAFYCYRTECES